MESLIVLLTWRHVTGAAAAYLATIAFYRLFLHPLAGFPGPKLAALTRWYEGYYDVIKNGQYTFKIAEMHRKYGISAFLPSLPFSLLLPSTFIKTAHQVLTANSMQVRLSASVLMSYILSTQPSTRTYIAKMGSGISTPGLLTRLRLLVQPYGRRLITSILFVATWTSFVRGFPPLRASPNLSI
jgi:hypothetical protein